MATSHSAKRHLLLIYQPFARPDREQGTLLIRQTAAQPEHGICWESIVGLLRLASKGASVCQRPAYLSLSQLAPRPEDWLSGDGLKLAKCPKSQPEQEPL